MPRITNFMNVNRKASMRLLQIEMTAERSPQLLERMARTNRPTFTAVREKAHVLHRTHHRLAVAYMSLVHRVPQTPVDKFAFYVTGATPRPKIAEWRTPPAEAHIEYADLWLFVLNHKPMLDQVDDSPGEYDLTVDACKDCNIMMTCKFWVKYHLYTSRAQNDTRVIPDGVINIYTANMHGHTELREAQAFWTRQGNANAGGVGFPTRQYDKRYDYPAAYIAYYIHQCLAPLRVVPANTRIVMKDMLRRTMARLAWIILQVTCLVCEKQLGAQKSGQQRRTTKTLVGNIELYASYFGWTLACFQYPVIRTRCTFSKWHVFYVSDLQNSESFETHETSLLADEVIPPHCDIPSKDLLKQVCTNLLQTYQRHMQIVRDLLAFYDSPGNQLQVYSDRAIEHFVHPSDWTFLQQRVHAATPNNLDSLLNHIGVNAVWTRLLQLSNDYPQKIKQMLVHFHRTWMDYERKNARRRGFAGMTLEQAAQAYNKCLMNPAVTDRQVQRGRWGCVRDLVTIHAFDYSNEI
jgi:hypothetical protein